MLLSTLDPFTQSSVKPSRTPMYCGASAHRQRTCKLNAWKSPEVLIQRQPPWLFEVCFLHLILCSNALNGPHKYRFCYCRFCSTSSMQTVRLSAICPFTCYGKLLSGRALSMDTDTNWFLILVLRKKVSKPKKRVKEEEIEKGQPEKTFLRLCWT